MKLINDMLNAEKLFTKNNQKRQNQIEELIKQNQKHKKPKSE